MYGRCCNKRPRPFCGGQGQAYAGAAMMQGVGAGVIQTPVNIAPGPVIPVGGACQTFHAQPQVVVEPALVAAPNIFNHHQTIKHIQPVVTQDVHHYHVHHEYAVQEQKKCDEVLKHEHGLCGPASTQPAQPCPAAPVMPGCGCR